MNRLAAETSPYLRQHAENPVDWYPWGDEAFAAARAGDRPILLSVGYASCHWCHVMAHESFEDAEVASLMNDRFVNVKVDREERPDVDAVYMEATQALTGQGGWPMPVFLDPDGRPFFAGTYFPRERRGGMISFPELCERIGELWRSRRDDLEEQAGQLTAALGRSAQLDPGDGLPGAGVLDDAVAQLARDHDPRGGGFGGAPKFPQAMSLDFLVGELDADLAGAPEAGAPADELVAVVETSLDAMASGGIYDHVGGGFARYSVDPYWLVPHFEKMLYDNALLARAYLHGWQVSGEPFFARVCTETLDWALRELRQDEGGFASALDADSEGVEGRFYVWTPEQVRDALGIVAERALPHFGIAQGGNFEGASIPVRATSDPENLAELKARLLAAREQRVRPGLDDKRLTAWNALMIAALADAGAAMERSDYLDAAGPSSPGTSRTTPS